MTKLICLARFFVLESDLSQLSCIQPIAAAAGTLVDLHFTFGAKVMAMQLHIFAAGTFTFARAVDDYGFVSLNVKQRFAGSLIFLVDTFQLKGVKPNATTSPLANIDHQAAHLHLSELVKASWTFHKPNKA